jgi:hypothetical protein
MKDEKIIKELPILNNKANVLEVSLYYSKGGMNYYTGANERRGLYLSVTPVERTPTSKGFVAFSGVKQHVKEMARFNQKQFDTFEVDTEVMNRMIDHVILKNNLEVVKEAAS